jgi:hypothetical protein
MLVDILSLSSKKVTRTEKRELRRYRQFYQTYPQIRETVSPELQQQLLGPLGIKKFLITTFVQPYLGSHLELIDI